MFILRSRDSVVLLLDKHLADLINIIYIIKGKRQIFFVAHVLRICSLYVKFLCSKYRVVPHGDMRVLFLS